MRSRAYTREVRNKAIARKKKINGYHHDMGWYKFDGMYSKGKVHCSCVMCAFRKYDKNEVTDSDARKIEAMNYKLAEFYKEAS